MSISPFNWQAQPSVFAKERKNGNVIDLAPKSFHVYSKAEAERESTIKRLSAEIESDHAASQEHAHMSTFYRDRARKKAKQVADLVAGREAGAVRRMELERGIA